MNPALLLVDIQQDYFPNGKMEVISAQEASIAASRLLRYFRERGFSIIHIQHVSTRPGATFFIPDTEGINIHESVTPLPGEPVITKNFPNSFLGTRLDEHLESRAIKELVICGMMSQMCIDATVRAAFDKGYTCLVAHDACAARSLVFNDVNVPADHVHSAYMASLGAVYANVLTAEEIIESLRIC